MITMIVWQQIANPLCPADTVSDGSTWVSQCHFGILFHARQNLLVFKWAELVVESVGVQWGGAGDRLMFPTPEGC